MVSILFHYTRCNSELQQASSKIQTHKWIEARDENFTGFHLISFKYKQHHCLFRWKQSIFDRSQVRGQSDVWIWTSSTSPIEPHTNSLMENTFLSLFHIGKVFNYTSLFKWCVETLKHYRDIILFRPNWRQRQSLGRFRSCQSETDQSDKTQFLFYEWIHGSAGPEHSWVSMKPPG